jgi:hypothetical protein
MTAYFVQPYEKTEYGELTCRDRLRARDEIHARSMARLVNSAGAVAYCRTPDGRVVILLAVGVVPAGARA